jgi:hypothetical protein
MLPRLRTLKRLMGLYGVVEQAHSVELQRMAAAVREAQQAIGIQQEVMLSARLEARDALMAEDRLGREIAKIRRDNAGWKRRRLEQVRLEREVLSNTAREQYVATRVKREQMNRLAEGVAAREEIDEKRRAQTAADDHFLARKRWSDTRSRYEKAKINPS